MTRSSRPTPLPTRLEPERSPEWGDPEPASEAELRAPFERATSLTVGVEEELMLLDPVSFELMPAVDLALARTPPGDARFAREIRQSQLEIVTPVGGNAQAVGIALARARLDLAGVLQPDVAIASAGTHPWCEDWGALSHGDRYQEIADEYPWATAGSIPSGLHVHVAVPGADRALDVYNALRSYLPELAALGANSPFLAGRDTGLASSRMTLNDAFHRVRTPPAFESWSAFAAFVRWGQTGRLFPDATHLWWDLRLHARLGTLELRVLDAQTRIDDVIALVAVYQSLVAALVAERDRTERLEVHPTERIAENAYRALRYGVNGWMVDLDTGRREQTRERITRLLDRVEPPAATFGNETAIQHARALVADNGAERQRYVARSAPDRDSLRALIGWLAHETVGSAKVALERRA